ncbi:exo-beta-N-acetylmuramidase NamZ family protein [Formosa sp. S-31]|uniref:exo-beta-N-acetylmuramidase NamZ family protein n=1 Tax=Formosa sp. S-31 TaxID=2790949 RepID=UPI003EBBB451
MPFNVFKNTVLLFVFIMISYACNSSTKASEIKQVQSTKTEPPIIVGANRTEIYLPMLQGKKIGIVANQTSVIFKTNGQFTHIVDSLLVSDVKLTKVFSPEHGFRGQADAGEVVKDGIDTKTNLPIVSLYGSNKKPSKEQLNDIDLLVFDIQDVGARFYTYISTLHYVMEACAENNIPVLVLDRPNPNGHYIDGPVLEPEHSSFVGMHPIPVVHGLTIGEYAQMINGEGWLKHKISCDLTVIPMEHYTHTSFYHLPIKPSPNLPNDQSINLYPSLCLFEGTNVNAGRGTDKQFQIYGSPHLPKSGFSYTPKPNAGAKHPKHEGKLCYGEDLSKIKPLSELNLSYLITAYSTTSNKGDFFNSFFTKLAGTKQLQQQIESGLTVNEIKASWEKDLSDFKQKRNKYLIYK